MLPYQRKKELKKKKERRDLMTTSTLMIAVTNTRSFRCQETKHALKRTFIQENAYLIHLHGRVLVEDFNNFRLFGSAASHANTKLPAAKYMVWKF